MNQPKYAQHATTAFSAIGHEGRLAPGSLAFVFKAMNELASSNPDPETERHYCNAIEQELLMMNVLVSLERNSEAARIASHACARGAERHGFIADLAAAVVFCFLLLASPTFAQGPPTIEAHPSLITSVSTN
jgi:hypothetical protein